jgi:hypothetical protein
MLVICRADGSCQSGCWGQLQPPPSAVTPPLSPGRAVTPRLPPADLPFTAPAGGTAHPVSKTVQQGAGTENTAL